ncbi:nitroreductase family deazaflavin-dependent oxidoreductase [Streptomyces sp. NPDC051994]|uniref:nitroreductase family deazaflavin-dependent oxidoreductase n=1 Tax=unclassified Streptomyces TaxID=2593676 RepID=UPI0034339E89
MGKGNRAQARAAFARAGSSRRSRAPRGRAGHLDTIALGTTGHRSGIPRATPLAAHRAADGTWLVVGSNFGRSHHPAWSSNLLHRPHATLTAQGFSWRVRARQLTVHEKEQQRDRILLAIPFYDTYAPRTGRDIRVFCLTPVTALPADRAAQA